MNKDNDKTMSLLKQLSIQDFLNVGIDQVAYIKKAPNLAQDKISFSIHAADGSQISIMDSHDMALAAIRVNDLYPVTVH